MGTREVRAHTSCSTIIEPWAKRESGPASPPESTPYNPTPSVEMRVGEDKKPSLDILRVIIELPAGSLSRK